MAVTMKPAKEISKVLPPRVLVVDDEPSLHELVRDVIGQNSDCQIVSASSLKEARKILESQTIQLVLLDMHLPDGDGMTLLPVVREKQPAAQSVIITGHASLDGAIGAMRAGVSDFLAKPFTAEHLRDRVKRALQRNTLAAKIDKRLVRLRSAVRGLNLSRRMVSKKVDLLCNDLVAAYGELSKQLDGVRTQEAFRKLLDGAADLEQLLCHAMDWILRHCGYSNVAIWLSAEDGESELGAYMKYTIAGDKEFTESMKQSLLPLVQREGFVHLEASELAQHLSEPECKHLAGQSLIAVNCTYLGETLATIVIFRDSRSPFVDDDAAMLKAISPLFATSLASIVRREHGEIDEDDGDGESPFYDDSAGNARDDEDQQRRDKKRRDKERREKENKDRHAADWWKRGEPPPF